MSFFGAVRNSRPLFILFFIGTLNYLDRVLLSILQIPIKEELSLSDTQLGLLLGAAFGLVYTTVGLPVGRLADRTSRSKVLAFAVMVWCGLTALCGMVVGFWSLLLCRMGVAVGEAACAPISQSLLTDLYPPQKRATAVSYWAFSLPIGMMLGYAVSGYLATTIGWRMAFVVVGLVGFLGGPIAWLYLKDPPRGAHDELPPDAMPPLLQTLHLMWNCKTYRFLGLGLMLNIFTYHGALAWLPQFYARNFGLSMEYVGVAMAVMFGALTGVGILLGGIISDRLSRRDSRWAIWFPAAGIAIFAIGMLLQYNLHDVRWALAAGGVAAFFSQMSFAPGVAISQTLMPPAVRTFTGAFWTFLQNALTMTLAPLLVGLLSDGTALGLSASLSITVLGSLLSLPCLLIAARHVGHEYPRALGLASA